MVLKTALACLLWAIQQHGQHPCQQFIHDSDLAGLKLSDSAGPQVALEEPAVLDICRFQDPGVDITMVGSMAIAVMIASWMQGSMCAREARSQRDHTPLEGWSQTADPLIQRSRGLLLSQVNICSQALCCQTRSKLLASCRLQPGPDTLGGTCRRVCQSHLACRGSSGRPHGFQRTHLKFFFISWWQGPASPHVYPHGTDDHCVMHACLHMIMPCARIPPPDQGYVPIDHEVASSSCFLRHGCCAGAWVEAL